MSLAALLLALALPARAASSGAVVALDAGHGGFDLGQHLNGVTEREFALGMARKVQKELEKRGLTPFLTRFDDDFVALSDRVVRAEEVGGKVFLSIHADNNPDRKGRGVMLWVYGQNKSIPKGPPRQAHERILPPPPKEQVAASRRLAERMQIVLKKRGIRVAGYVDRGPFAVLKSPGMASVLVEVGNLRDKEEARLMKDPAHQDRLAAALAEAVSRFLELEPRR